MSFAFGVSDVMAISRLAFKVYTACKGAPDKYGNISDEVKSLHIVIDSAAQHFERTTLSDDKRQKGQEVLRGCQNLLENLDSLIGKYNSLAPASTSTSTGTSTNQALQRVRLGAGLVLGTEDITTLRVRLISNTTLLNGFIQRFDILTTAIKYIVLISLYSCDSDEMRARLDNILGLRRTTSRDSLVSLAGSINTKKAFKKLIKDLCAIGITADMINKNEKEIKGLLGPEQADSSGQIDDSTSGHQLPEEGDSSDAGASFGDQSQQPDVGSSSGTEASPISTISQAKSRSRFAWARPPIDFLVGLRMLAAAEAGDTQLLISTLKYVRNINFTDVLNKTALHKAADRGHRDIVQLLLSKGASLEATDHHKNTPLHNAAWSGHTSTVELLFAKGASVQATNSASSSTPLHLAAWNGHTSTVELLLAKGASVEATDWEKDTPLHNAARRGHTSTVELLLAKGASVQATNSYSSTPLHNAAWSGHASTVELLLANGASVEAINDEKKTPLHIARLIRHTDTIKLLKNRAAELGIPGNIRTVSG